MFVTLPEYRFPVPSGLFPPGARHWRTVELSMNTAWFALTIRRNVPDTGTETFLLVWDTDLVDAIAALDAEVLSLLCLAPAMSGRERGWRSIRVREIWDAAQTDDGSPCILFIDEDGGEYAGLFFDKIQGAVRDRLLVRVRPGEEKGAAETAAGATEVGAAVAHVAPPYP